MSLSASDLRTATTEALASGADPDSILEALVVINRKLALLEAHNRQRAMACGYRADGVAKIEGLTETLTSVLRRFAACGVVSYEDVPDLHRHVSAIRKALKTLAPSIVISTLQRQGYEITAGFDDLYRILHVAKVASLAAPGFTVKQTAILQLIAARGSAHVDQIPCLQRHMSNIRKRLPKAIDITTRPGEGLYEIDAKSRAKLVKLLAGERIADDPPAPKSISHRKQKEEAALLAA